MCSLKFNSCLKAAICLNGNIPNILHMEWQKNCSFVSLFLSFGNIEENFCFAFQKSMFVRHLYVANSFADFKNRILLVVCKKEGIWIFKKNYYASIILLPQAYELTDLTLTLILILLTDAIFTNKKNCPSLNYLPLNTHTLHM